MSTMLLCVGKYWLCARKMGCFDFEASNFIPMRRTFYAFCSFPTRFTPYTIDDPLSVCWFCMLLFTYIGTSLKNKLAHGKQIGIVRAAVLILLYLQSPKFWTTIFNFDVIEYLLLWTNIRERWRCHSISLGRGNNIFSFSFPPWDWQQFDVRVRVHENEQYSIFYWGLSVEMTFSSECLQLNAFNRKVLRPRRGQTPNSNGTQLFLHRSIDESHSLYRRSFITCWNSTSCFT